jgi:hypothetical protein
MRSPIPAILTGRYRIRGLRRAAMIKTLFSPLLNQEWKPVDRGVITEPVQK